MLETAPGRIIGLQARSRLFTFGSLSSAAAPGGGGGGVIRAARRIVYPGISLHLLLPTTAVGRWKPGGYKEGQTKLVHQQHRKDRPLRPLRPRREREREAVCVLCLLPRVWDRMPDARGLLVV